VVCSSCSSCSLDRVGDDIGDRHGVGSIRFVGLGPVDQCSQRNNHTGEFVTVEADSLRRKPAEILDRPSFVTHRNTAGSDVNRRHGVLLVACVTGGSRCRPTYGWDVTQSARRLTSSTPALGHARRARPSGPTDAPFAVPAAVQEATSGPAGRLRGATRRCGQLGIRTQRRTW
jgi:hypothetical protein